MKTLSELLSDAQNDRLPALYEGNPADPRPLIFQEMYPDRPRDAQRHALYQQIYDPKNFRPAT